MGEAEAQGIDGAVQAAVEVGTNTASRLPELAAVVLVVGLVLLGLPWFIDRMRKASSNGNGHADFKKYVEEETRLARERDGKIFEKFDDLGGELGDVRERLANIEGRLGIVTPKAASARRG